MKPTGFLKCVHDDGEVEMIPWTDPAVYEVARSALVLPKARRALTPAEEIWEAVQVYCKEQGIRVPVEDAKFCLAAIAEEKKEMGRPPTPPPEQEESVGPRKHISGLPLEEDDPRPFFEGQPTPEFWAWARRQRIRTNAEREAKGLAPLPTAREKAAAKAAKAKEREAKDAEKKEKERAALEKKRAKVEAAAAKLAAKEAKRAAAEAKAAAKAK
jgi:hypothetical protein